MILTLLGAALTFIGAYYTSDKNYTVLIIGVVLIVLGLVSVNVRTERFKARKNFREYWANGKKPDWVEEEEREPKYVYRGKTHYGLRIVVVLVIMFVVAFFMLVKK